MKKLFLKLVISVFILFLLFYKIGFLKIYETLLRTNILFLILIILFYLPIYILGISNLFILFRGIKFKDLIKPYLLSWASSMFVPGKFGELSIFYFLKKKVSFDKSVPVIFIDKIISFFVDLLFVLLGLLFFEAVLNLDSLYNLIIIGFLILFFSLFFVFWGKTRRLFSKYVLRGYSKYFKGFFKSLKSYFLFYKKSLFLNFILTVIRLVFTAFIVYLGFLAISPDLKINLFYIMVVTSIISIASLIPIALSGLGVRELLAVLLYGKLGIEADIIFSAYILLLFVKYFMGGLVLLIFFEFNVKKEKHPGCMGLIRYHRLKKAKRFLVGKTLDVGCSDGASLYYYNNVNVEGIEIDKNLVKKAKQWGKAKVGSAEKIPYKDRSFDTVVCTDVIEHVQNRGKALKEIERVAKKRIVISFPLRPFKEHPWFLKEVPKFKGWKIIYKDWLMPAIGIPYKGKNFNSEIHMDIVKDKWWFVIFRFFRPFLIFIFNLAGKFEKNTVFLVFERQHNVN